MKNTNLVFSMENCCFCDFGISNSLIVSGILKTQYNENLESNFNFIGLSQKKINLITILSFQILLHDACHWILEGHKPFNGSNITHYDCSYQNDFIYLIVFYKKFSIEANQKEKDALIYETFYIRERFGFLEEDIKQYLYQKILGDLQGGSDLSSNDLNQLVDDIWEKSKNIDYSVIRKIENIFSAWSKNISIKDLNEKEFVI